MVTRLRALPMYTRWAVIAFVPPLLMAVAVALGSPHLSAWSVVGIGAAGAVVVAAAGWWLSRPWDQLAAACRALTGGRSWPGNSYGLSPEIQGIEQGLQALETRYQQACQSFRATLQQAIAELCKLADGQALGKLTGDGPWAEAVHELNTAFQQAADKITALRTRYNQMTRFVHELPIGILALDGQGIIRYVNVAGERLLDRPARRLMQQPLGSILQTPPYPDPWGRLTLSGPNFGEWLRSNGNSSEACCVVQNKDQQHWLAIQRYAVPGPLTYCLLRDVTSEQKHLAQDRGQIRQETLRTAWTEMVQNIWGPVQGILASSRLLSGDIKQTANKEIMLQRIQAIRQQGTVTDVYLRLVFWLCRCRWGELPTPLVTEFAAVEPARRAADQLAPLLRDRENTTLVTDRDGGYMCGDDTWVETALLGILYHATWANKGATMGIVISRHSGRSELAEDVVTFDVLDAGPALTEAQKRDLEQPYGDLYPPTYLTDNTVGFLPGLMLAAELSRRMGGHIEWQTTASGLLAVRLSIPTRQPYSWAAAPLGELIDAGPVEELVMGWRLARL